MLRRDQGKLAFGTLADSSGRIQLFARADVTPRFDEFTALSLGDWVGRHRRGHDHPAGRAVGAGRRLDAAGRGPPPVPRQVARPDRPRHPLPPALRRPVGHRRGPRHLPPAQPGGQPPPPLARGPGLRRGGDADLPPHPRRGPGQALRHPPQRPRHRPLPAHRPRALPEAAGGGRLREGVRDRAGVPQRGHLAPPQPRVHDARALPGLRRLHRPHDPHRGAGGRAGRRAARRRPSSPTAAASST